MPATRTLTVKDVARLRASHVALDVPEIRAQLARLVDEDERERQAFIDAVGAAVGAVIDSVWEQAHLEGHTCKSRLCRPHGR